MGNTDGWVMIVWAAVTESVDGVNQTVNISSSQLWRLEIPDQGASRTGFLVKSLFLV